MPSPVSFSHIAVLGAGAWGTALALAALAAGRKTSLWVREDDVLADIRAGRGNRFLPGVAIPKELQVTGDLAEACKADALLLAVPAQVLHVFADGLKSHLTPNQPLVICAKGIEKDSGKLVTEVAAESLPGAAARHSVGAVLCARCGAGAAHRRDHRGAKAIWRLQLQAALGSRRAFVPMPATISSAWRWAARPRMSMPSPAAWSKAWDWARMPAPRCWRAASRNCRGWAKIWAPGARP